MFNDRVAGARALMDLFQGRDTEEAELGALLMSDFFWRVRGFLPNKE